MDLSYASLEILTSIKGYGFQLTHPLQRILAHTCSTAAFVYALFATLISFKIYDLIFKFLFHDRGNACHDLWKVQDLFHLHNRGNVPQLTETMEPSIHVCKFFVNPYMI